MAPVVPLYGDRKVEETLSTKTPLSTNIPSVSAFGGGEPLAQGFGAMEKIILQAKKEADEVAVQEYDNNLAMITQEISANALKRKGKDAAALPDEVSTDFDKRIAELDKTLNGSVQRSAARQRALERKQQLLGVAERHSNAEISQYKTGVYKSGIDLARQEAITNSADPAFVKGSIAKQHAYLDKLAEMDAGIQGSLDELKLEAASKTHMGVINSMVSTGNDMSAESYLKENKDSLLGDDKIRAQAVVEEGSRAAKTMKMGDEIFGKSGSVTAAYKMTDQIEDAKLRKQVESRVEYLFERQKQNKQAADESQSAYIANILEKSGGDYEAIPANIRANLKIEDRVRYQNYADKFRKQGRIDDNLEVVEEIETLKTTKEFLGMDFNSSRYMNELSTGTRQKYIQEQGKLRKNDKDAIATVDKLSTERAAIRSIMVQSGIKDPTDQAATDKVFMQVVAEEEAIKKRPLTLLEKQGLASDMLVKMNVGKTFYGAQKSKFKYQVLPSEIEAEAITYDQLPPSEIPKIKAALATQGNRNPSQTEMLNLYKMDIARRLQRNLTRANK